jgi:TonB family protein
MNRVNRVNRMTSVTRANRASQRLSLGAALCAAVLSVPLAAPAQTGGVEYYTAAKLVHQGTSNTPIAGAGTVVVQVLVNKDGTFKVVRVIRSTNHGDDATALDIAKNSKYRPATRGTTPQTSFYDFTLKFTGTGATQTSDAPSGGELEQYARMIAAGNYSGAQSGLKTYVAQHPDEAKAQLELGVADADLGQAQDATAAFDKAGTIPENVAPVAARAYADVAAADLKANDGTAAVAAAKRAAELAPGVFTYNTLGLAELNAGSNDAAVADLEKARTLAASDGKIKPQDKARIDGNLISAYLAVGKKDAAQALVAEAKAADPSETGSQTAFANFYIKAAQADTSAGKPADAAASYEQAAAVDAPQAVALYGQAAFALLAVKPTPDYAKVKADADKALAIDPDDAIANFAAGVALGNTPGKSADALTYLNKADASAKKANNASLSAQIENVIKQLGGNK